MTQQQIEKYKDWLNSQIEICKKDKECESYRHIFEMSLITFEIIAEEKELSHIEFTSDIIDLE